MCKCTETKPCWPPCSWEPGEPDLCSACAYIILKLRDWLIGAHNPSFYALKFEAQKPTGPGLQKIARGSRG